MPRWPWSPPPPDTTTLAAINRLWTHLDHCLWTHLDQQFALIRKDLHAMSTTMQTAIDSLSAQVAAETTVNASAVALINGFSPRLQAALDAAANAGASATQLQALNDLAASIETNTAVLSTAVVQNTPAA